MRQWVRVKDDTTGAVYDVDARSVRDGMTVLPDAPKNEGTWAHPRPTKYPPDALRRRRAATTAEESEK